MFTSDVINVRMCTPSVSDVNYHKVSHGAAFYAHNKKNVNVMLELLKPSMHDKVIGRTRKGFTEAYAHILSSECDTDLWPCKMVLVCDTSACNDNHLCLIIFNPTMQEGVMDRTDSGTHKRTKKHTYGQG